MTATTEQGQEIRYILLSFGLWLLVEYLTVWHAKMAQWLALFPYVLFQYLFIILIFSYFIFRKRWTERDLFLLMLAVMFSFELLWQNPFLLNPLAFAPVSLLLISIWGFLTFIPLWLVQGTLKNRKLPAVACMLWLPLGFIFAVVFH